MQDQEAPAWRVISVRIIQVGVALLTFWAATQWILATLGEPAWQRNWWFFMSALVVSVAFFLAEMHYLVRFVGSTPLQSAIFYALVIASGAGIAFL